jgi:hypothetical protein
MMAKVRRLEISSCMVDMMVIRVQMRMQKYA